MSVVDEPRHCPSPEILAAFVDAKLTRNQAVELTAHLANCAECRLVVESVAEFQADESGQMADEQPRRAPWRWMSIAALLVIGLALTPFTIKGVHAYQSYQAMSALMKAVGEQQQRPVTARVVGQEFAEQPRVMRSGDPEASSTDDKLIVLGAAGEVLDVAEKDKSAAALHDAGVAHLFIGQFDEASAELKQATHLAPNDARIWSDYSAALAAKGTRDKSMLPAAVEAADTAIRLNPKLAEAYFNRAVALEGKDAIAAWNIYLQHDAASRWANEAKEQVERIKSFSAD
jgi:tetratricopeptide (TPR) repeat protein